MRISSGRAEQRNSETPKLRDSPPDRSHSFRLVRPGKDAHRDSALERSPDLDRLPHGDMDDMAAAAKLGPGDWADILEQDLRDVKDQTEAMKWEAGMYGLNELIVLRPTQSPDVEVGRRRFDVLVACRTPEFGACHETSAALPQRMTWRFSTVR